MDAPRPRPQGENKLEQRVIEAAEAALADHGYVSPTDVLIGMRMLYPQHVEAWRRGRIAFLEELIQGNLSKISRAMAVFRQWARDKALLPSETRYVRRTRSGVIDLQFSQSGDPEIEKAYRTHYVSPDLPERKREKLEQRLEKAPETVVFQIVRDSACSECGVEIEREELLYMEANQPLCMACAKLDDLEFLAAGDAALTRRAAKYSGRMAVVLRFSRSRKRYERQGILVEPEAIEKAERECADDAPQRAAARKRAAAAREEEDRALGAAMTAAIQALFPGCPPDQARAIAGHTARRGSGRVGRTAAGKRLDKHALTLAVRAAVRHRRTNYDELLAGGLDRDRARERVHDQVGRILEDWSEGAGA